MKLVQRGNCSHIPVVRLSIQRGTLATGFYCLRLFSFAPRLLSSPHVSKRMRADDYVATLVGLDGSIEDGEAQAWMTIMACCDAFHQRASVDRGSVDGDARVSRILMDLGPELLRPRRH
mmetsp:Transcript_212/g.363  ORF Transcript_212/g.363 Transcript_212/m.363 type:complete len:119 (-) Transcript_212:261-617(-)